MPTVMREQPTLSSFSVNPGRVGSDEEVLKAIINSSRINRRMRQKLKPLSRAVVPNTPNTNAAPVTGKVTETRVAAGAPGSHAISGSWRMAKFDTISDNAIVMTLKVDGDMLHMSTPTGQSYAAKLDGTDAPYKGDPGISSVSVKWIDKTTIEETDKRDGKPITTAQFAVMADGKTMNLTSHDLLAGTTSHISAAKQ